MGIRALTQGQVRRIESAVDQIFDRAKARYLGPLSLDKRIYAGFQSELSLPGVFAAASRSEGAVPSHDVMSQLIRGAGNYLDAYRAQAKVETVRRVQDFLVRATADGVQTDVETVLGGEIADVWAKTTADVKRLIDTEATNARNLGALDGIVSVNMAEGVEDPVVFFVVVRDDSLCGECKRLHLLEDGVTPRVWRLSSLGNGYHKRGQSNPKISGLHPHCRCSIVTLLPGYGFGDDGMVRFIGPDHNEHVKQQRS